MIKPESIVFGRVLKYFDHTGQWTYCRVIRNNKTTEKVLLEALDGSLLGKTWWVPYGQLASSDYYKPLTSKK